MIFQYLVQLIGLTMCTMFCSGKLTEFWSNSRRCIHQMNVRKVLKAPLICGQPTDETHPHIMKKGEVSTCVFH